MFKPNVTLWGYFLKLYIVNSILRHTYQLLSKILLLINLPCVECYKILHDRNATIHHKITLYKHFYHRPCSTLLCGRNNLTVLLALHNTAFREAMIEKKIMLCSFINNHVPMKEKPVVCQHNAVYLDFFLSITTFGYLHQVNFFYT